MKISKLWTLTTAVCFLCASGIRSFAIEGLHLSLECSNVVLTWPSVYGKTYIVQYRPTLDTNSTWQTLTSAWPADSVETNTIFVHSNVVIMANCSGGGGSFAMMSSGGEGESSMVAEVQNDTPTEPMAYPTNGIGEGIPLQVFPPGFDMSGYYIYDPSSDKFTSGALLSSSSGGGMQANDIEFPPSEEGALATNSSGSVSETGFYQVVQNGVQILDSCLTNLLGIASNTINLRFEAGNDVGTLKESTVLVDGARYRGVSPLFSPGFSGALQIDTSFLENGDHTFQVVVGWQNPNIFDVNTPVIHQYSDPFTVTVSNVIYYPDWQDEIGELGFAHYSFKTTCTNADWQIDIYDVSNSLAKTLTGHTIDGIVETNWDLVDINGITRATNDLDSEFSALVTVGDPTTKAAPKQAKAIAYPTQGQWVIAYQDIIGNMANSNAMRNAVYDFGSIGAQFGGAVSVFPTPGHPEYGQTFPLRFNWTNNPSPPTPLQQLADEKALISLLTNNVSRNFFCLGHGGLPTDVNMIAYYLNKHYYRFVFLNGCSSALGGWPAAFGINYSSTKSLSYFQTQGIRPRTFLGYTKDIFYASTGNYFDPSTGQNYPGRVEQRCIDFLNNFEFYWYFYYDVSTSIYHAELDTPDLRYGWLDGPDLTLLGYEWLYIDQYNHRTDWSN